MSATAAVIKSVFISVMVVVMSGARVVVPLRTSSKRPVLIVSFLGSPQKCVEGKGRDTKTNIERKK